MGMQITWEEGNLKAVAYCTCYCSGMKFKKLGYLKEFVRGGIKADVKNGKESKSQASHILHFKWGKKQLDYIQVVILKLEDKHEPRPNQLERRKSAL